jgi:hypothetical protein
MPVALLMTGDQNKKRAFKTRPVEENGKQGSSSAAWQS